MFFSLLEQVHTPAARLPPLFAALALVAFAKREDVIRVVAPHVSHGFKSLVTALEDKVDRPMLEKSECVVVLDDQCPVVTARLSRDSTNK